jgi:hypothetical protein
VTPGTCSGPLKAEEARVPLKDVKSALFQITDDGLVSVGTQEAFLEHLH